MKFTPKELPVQTVPPLPEVYQIEVSATCNYNCIMCPAQFFKRQDETKFLSLDLLEKIISQGDLDASYFVELQLRGEPTLHPDLALIIETIKSSYYNIKIGMSTNGSLLDEQKAYDLVESGLDYITFSMDSISQYPDIRRGGKLDTVLHNVNSFIRNYHKTVAIDVQVLQLPGWEKELSVLKEIIPNVVPIRTFPNCYLAFLEPGSVPDPASEEICLNPWLSCSISCTGNVLPCCISQGDDIIYGNLKNQTLREIWAGDMVKEVRRQFIEADYSPICAKCYMRSPFLFHWYLFLSNVTGKMVYENVNKGEFV